MSTLQQPKNLKNRTPLNLASSLDYQDFPALDETKLDVSNQMIINQADSAKFKFKSNIQGPSQYQSYSTSKTFYPYEFTPSYVLIYIYIYNSLEKLFRDILIICLNTTIHIIFFMVMA